ncbi:MAG: hypothetical protein QMD12_03625 [Candidatus Aenigmarchaeota archaeon]|nr:hypothetical protein [Candidatus Aenigmarchaeota archaeon]
MVLPSETAAKKEGIRCGELGGVRKDGKKCTQLLVGANDLSIVCLHSQHSREDSKRKHSLLALLCKAVERGYVSRKEILGAFPEPNQEKWEEKMKALTEKDRTLIELVGKSIDYSHETPPFEMETAWEGELEVTNEVREAIDTLINSIDLSSWKETPYNKPCEACGKKTLVWIGRRKVILTKIQKSKYIGHATLASDVENFRASAYICQNCHTLHVRKVYTGSE